MPQPIKKSLRDLPLEELKKKKEEIINYLLDNNKITNERKNQGFATTDVLNNLIEAKEKGDTFTENVIKYLFFE